MGKKKEEAPPPGSPAWMATFSDLMNLLLCFFVLLFSMSTIDEAKLNEIIASMSSSFSVFSSGSTSIGEGILISNGVSQLNELAEYINSTGRTAESESDTDQIEVYDTQSGGQEQTDISEQTGIPCFVAYYRRYLPYFQRVKEIVQGGTIGKIQNIQVRFAVPPRQLDYEHPETLPWRLQPDIAGGGYFYDLAPHQLDLLQDMFGVILEARGICANRGELYQAEDSVSACFSFENGLPGSGSWCFVAHESAREDSIEIIGDRGKVIFSVFDYAPIQLHTSEGAREIVVPNPPYVQFPLIKSMIEHLQGLGVCTCTSMSATPVNWALDRILGKL